MQKKKTLDLRKQKGKKQRKNKNSDIIVNKCWSVIRMFAEHPFFTGPMITVMETTCTPLLLMITNVEHIDFDDDILFFLSSLLKKKQATDSQLLRDAFQFFPRFHKKYNYIFGPLLECLSLYMMYSGTNELGVDFIGTSPELLGLLFTMGKNSLEPSEQADDPYLQYSQEGAILFQLIFENLRGPLVIAMIRPVLELCWSRMMNSTPTLARCILNVILAATLQDADEVLKFLEA